jgi:hypothetical protein
MEKVVPPLNQFIVPETVRLPFIVRLPVGVNVTPEFITRDPFVFIVTALGLTLAVTVTTWFAAIITSSPAMGAVPPTQVVPWFQLPLWLDVLVAASDSCENINPVKIITTKSVLIKVFIIMGFSGLCSVLPTIHTYNNPLRGILYI